MTKTFEQAWAEKERKNLHYDRNAIGWARVGWEIAQAELEKLSHELNGLLARCLRDGGHRQVRVGLEQALAEAHMAVTNAFSVQAELAELKAEHEAMVALLRWNKATRAVISIDGTLGVQASWAAGYAWDKTVTGLVAKLGLLPQPTADSEGDRG